MALEGLYVYQGAFPEKKKEFTKIREDRHEWIHRLYKSHRTGEVFDTAMTRMPFPHRWRYDFIRALDYFSACNAPCDKRMSDAIELLKKNERRMDYGF